MYDKKITSNEPGLIILLIDQSSSMSETLVKTADGEAFSIAKMAKYVCDHFLNEIFQKCVRGNEFKPYLDLAVIGYGRETERGAKIRSALTKITLEQFPFSVTKLADCYTKKNQNTSDDASVVPKPRLEWTEERSSGDTPMLEAFKKSREIIENWLPNHKTSFPPFVINMSDGAPTDDVEILEMLRNGSVDDDLSQTQLISETNVIQKLGTDNGTCLICNCHISSMMMTQVLYPTDITEINNIDELAKIMFKMSSVIPDTLRKLGAGLGLPLEYNSKFFVFNADVGSLKSFMKFGTTATSSLSSETPELEDNNDKDSEDTNNES